MRRSVIHHTMPLHNHFSDQGDCSSLHLQPGCLSQASVLQGLTLRQEPPELALARQLPCLHHPWRASAAMASAARRQ